jgi:hypothetical protein
MRELSLNNLIILLLIFIFSNTDSAIASDKPDILKKIDPTYEHVDVIIETEWGSADKYEDVSVFVNKKNNKVSSIIVFQEKQKTEIYIIPSVTIKIINHNTEKLIEKYKLSE